ncbi:type VI secretion system protein TssF [Citrifermentans bemidjiense Bem]|uniref:Type VI secretion system protein TssF n=1 Tax=Citrifermentans bemidjiense (strain ATCC BAA-1014 / DSM 16622 / JCM 12645 / Bem) TaxID=404380 RepID=B5E872_CITBB|nr:type VI secretion system baseplate subunit TssF [Citrifermentans bemidjiense]ACH40041.1 type VI secretion system protein TssF [Citrifermentans bemidjiense Bem]
MGDDFLDYYEKELSFIREMGSEFARKYPRIAGRLLLEPDRCEDPHVERLIEAFALICARMHKKLDDDFPQITQSLLNVLYPHCTNPIPSLSVVRFSPLMKNVPDTGYLIPKGTTMFSRALDGVRCRFATAYPVTLWPMEVVHAELADQVITIRLKLHNKVTFARLPSDSVRFYLNGQRQHTFQLYEQLLNNVSRIECVAVGKKIPPVAMTKNCIRPMGFDEQEMLLPFPRQSFKGYRLLLEYFAFPEKYLFLEVAGLSSAPLGDFGDALDLIIHLEHAAEPSFPVSADTFCLNATPAVNLFSKIAEPIRIEHRQAEYRVVPDLRSPEAMEIFSIDRVSGISDTPTPVTRVYRPLYEITRLDCGSSDNIEGVWWLMQRKASGIAGDSGTEVFLSFCDLASDPADPPDETVTLRLTCSNRDLPGTLPWGDPAGDFDIEAAAPVEAINAVVRPTAVRRPALSGASQWRLISHLSLNHLSLLESEGAALKDMLRLYDFEDSPATRQQINGIVSVTSRHVTRRIGALFCRGVEVTIEFDERQFVGNGVYLFASVLERFLGEYVSLNSFVQLVAKSRQRKEVMKKWPPRNGDRVLL